MKKRKISQSGFVYIWFDKKHNRYYIGSHWGSQDDGYVCSSPWMKRAYGVRPEDFRRRILVVVNTTRKNLLEQEKQWLSLIKDEELGKRYYNLNKGVGHWCVDPIQAQAVIAKASSSKKGKPGWRHTTESKLKLSKAHTGKICSEEHCRNIGLSKKGKTPWMKGKTHTTEAKQAIGEKSRGRTATQLTKDKMSEVRKRMKWYTDGVIDRRIRVGEEVPDGFIPGRTKGLDNLAALASAWNDPKYRQHMSEVHKK